MSHTHEQQGARPTLAAPSDDRSPTACPALSAVSLEAVLRSLDADREGAGARYEAIRRKLVRFFECRGCPQGDELADKTIDRVGRRLAAGEHVRHSEVAAYFHGVARNVLRESWRPRRPAAPAPVLPRAVEADEGLGEHRLECLDACLAALLPEDRHLILRYYQAGERIHIDARRDLADSLGIGMNALRIRAHRIRARLEGCVRERLAAGVESVPPRCPGEEGESRRAASLSHPHDGPRGGGHLLVRSQDAPQVQGVRRGHADGGAVALSPEVP